MNFNMELPGLKGVNIEGIVEQENRMLVYISMPVKEASLSSMWRKNNEST